MKVGWLVVLFYFVLKGEKLGKGEERGDEKKERLKKYLTITIIVKINIF